MKNDKKATKLLWTLFSIVLIASMFYVTAPIANALVEPGVYTNPVPPGYGFIDFEEGTEGAVISSTIPGLQFTTTLGYDWVYADIRTGLYNARSLTDPSVNFGHYVVNGYFCAWLGPYMGQGRIDFTMGTASYFSVLTSTYSGVALDAYDSAGNLIATSGWASGNLYTYTFTRLTVQASGMAYIIVHDTGNYWEIDDLVTDAPGVGVVRTLEKTLSPTNGNLGDVVHTTLKANVPNGETTTMVDTLPPEWSYITGTFMVDSVSVTPTLSATPPPPPISDVISYTLTTSGLHTIEFDAKVTNAYWEDRTVTNIATATWYDELGNFVDQKEAKADFVIHPFEQLHKDVQVVKKVKLIPATPQFWREFLGGVKDIIVFDPPEITKGVALVRDYVVLREPMEAIPLELLTWQGTEYLPWTRIDSEPYILLPGQVAEYDILTDETTTAVLVRYTVAWQSTPDIIESHFINEAILESKSPQVIVGQLTNFDVHNDYHEPVDNFELELYGIQPSDIVGWFPGWGTPPQINAIPPTPMNPAGTEVIWMDPANPVPPCEWRHFGLHLKPGVIASAAKAYWTQLQAALTIKEKTNVQWTLVFEVTNPFQYTMTNVVITDRLGAELEIDPPFPYSITHGTVSYYTKGESAKVFLTWTIGNLLPGHTARLKILVSTDTNPGRGDCNKDGNVDIYDAILLSTNFGTSAYPYADFDENGIIDVLDAITLIVNYGATGVGKQEYTEPGVYELNSGATLKFIDPEQDMQLSAVTDSIYVTVLPEEDP